MSGTEDDPMGLQDRSPEDQGTFIDTDGYPADWTDIKVPSDSTALSYAEMLAKPPSFEKVKHIRSEAPSYAYLRRPVPSQGRWDSRMALQEGKLHDALQYYVRGLDNEDAKPDDFTKCAALVRSAFEDVRQARKQDKLKGVQNKAGILYGRADDDRIQLLSPQESEKLQTQKAFTVVVQKHAAFPAATANKSEGTGL